MGFIPTSIIDQSLGLLTSNLLVVCSGLPTDYYQASWGVLWTPGTPFTVGMLVRPPINNSYIYECVVGGDSGAAQPAWSTTEGEDFYDNTITFKTHRCYTLATVVLNPTDFSLSDFVGADLKTYRRLKVAAKTGITTVAAGVVGYMVLVNSPDKTIRYITSAFLNSGEDVLMGRVIQLAAMTIDVEVT